MTKKFYITTAIPYVNARPHIGHALEFVQADVIARYHRLLGDNVLLLSGGDENAVKNVQAAEKAGIPVQKFIDANTQLFRDLAEKLNVRFDVFQKGSSKQHYQSSQKLWKLCEASGDIYKKSYEGLYCVGCETFYTKDELDQNGECFEHPGKKLENVSEENYFFRLSKYQRQLIDLISHDTLKIIPEFRKNEMLSFLKQPLRDISISRTNERAKNWGVPVPDDPTQRIYVWFDALNIYQSGIGFGWDDKTYNRWWPADVHVIGKGIARFHAIYWPAFLLSAKLSLPKSLFVHGYLTVDGKKMSKTVGNVIDPFDLITKYEVDTLRYYLLREIPTTDDGDFSKRRLKELADADIANKLGDLVSRIKPFWPDGLTINQISFKEAAQKEFIQTMNEFRFNDALAFVWEKIKKAQKYISEKEPWKLSDTPLFEVVNEANRQIIIIAALLQPFLPSMSKTIIEGFSPWSKINPEIHTGDPITQGLLNTRK